ncbi:MAG TPA: VWA domain-containing protein, partial [Tepidisphaeraceae bacterium]|nr:VWA domain-containing protein [Tepidisphaeraceae bacterium]
VDATQVRSHARSCSIADLHLGFWRKPGVLQAMPLLTSFAFHAGLLLIAVVLIRAMPTIINSVTPQQVIIPFGTLVPHEGEIGPPNPVSMGEDLTRASMPDDASESNTPDFSKHPESPSTGLEGLDDQPNLDVTPISPGLRRNGGLNNESSGTNPGGKQPSLGFKNDSTTGIFIPGAAGTGSNARKVVYVCDASGSIGTSVPRKTALISELKKAIDQLDRSQFFNIVFFSVDDPIAFSNGELMQANSVNRQRAYDFLDKVVMSGQTDPIPAIKLAFRQKPELVYLLTDGEFTDVEPQSVIDTVETLSSKNSVMISTIMLDNTSEAEQETLRKIANMTGGEFSSVSAEETIRSSE